MGFIIKKLSSTDYDKILVNWWGDWRWKAPPKDFLPENGMGGYMVYDEEVPVCAGFVYVTNSKVGWCDWIISNFNYKDKVKRKEGLKKLISSLTMVLKKSKCKYAYALIKSDSLIKVYKEEGYLEAGQYNKEMIKIL